MSHSECLFNGMRRNQSRRSIRTDPFEIICQVGDQIIERYGVVRYCDYIEHNGQQWTRRTCWERFYHGQWIEIKDSFFAHSEEEPED